jgi:hypothetical protein
MQLQALRFPARPSRAGMRRMLALSGILGSVILALIGAATTISVETGTTSVTKSARAVELERPELMFEERRRRLFQALSEETANDGSGVYRYVDEAGVPGSLIWLRRYGFVSWESDGATVRRNFDFGSATLDENHLQLTSERGPTSRKTRRFTLVRWGEGTYVVPNDKMIRFCEAALHRREVELRQFPSTQDMDTDALQPGLPSVPSEYEAFLNRSRIFQ